MKAQILEALTLGAKTKNELKLLLELDSTKELTKELQRLVLKKQVEIIEGNKYSKVVKAKQPTKVFNQTFELPNTGTGNDCILTVKQIDVQGMKNQFSQRFSVQKETPQKTNLYKGMRILNCIPFFISIQ